MWLSLGIAAAGLYWPVWRKLAIDWWIDPDASHGLVVVPLAAIFAWLRRDEVLRTPSKPSLAGLAAVVAAMGLLVVGTLGAELFLTRVSFLLFLTGTVL